MMIVFMFIIWVGIPIQPIAEAGILLDWQGLHRAQVQPSVVFRAPHLSTQFQTLTGKTLIKLGPFL
jgi:hypothetical protein